MGFNFRINPIDNVTPKNQGLKPVEKVGEDANSKDNQRFDEEYEEAKEKIDKLLKDKKFKEKLKISLNSTDAKLPEKFEKAAVSFLKNELLSIAKNILSLSNEGDVNLEDTTEESTLSDVLARFILKLSKSQNTSKKMTKKCKLANAIDDKNAGYLSHYCKDILNTEIKCQKNKFKSKKLKKEEIINYFNSNK
ncbi:MAG: hypothetical protein K1060chlam5_00257 [Candidatus Anoxychlamydiales bacterium]|nr:hypothetical protein [Candidatus Anoxychlamydiales bacterium]